MDHVNGKVTVHGIGDREFIARRMSDGVGSNRTFLTSAANDWPRWHVSTITLCA